MNPKTKIIKCSGCGKKLVTIVLITPNPEIKWRGKANCPYCNDASFVENWDGVFVFEETTDCDILDFDDNDPINIKVKKNEKTNKA